MSSFSDLDLGTATSILALGPDFGEIALFAFVAMEDEFRARIAGQVGTGAGDMGAVESGVASEYRHSAVVAPDGVFTGFPCMPSRLEREGDLGSGEEALGVKCSLRGSNGAERQDHGHDLRFHFYFLPSLPGYRCSGNGGSKAVVMPGSRCWKEKGLAGGRPHFRR